MCGSNTSCPCTQKPSPEKPQVFQLLITLPERFLHKFEACLFFKTKGQQDSQGHREVFALQILPKEAPLAVAFHTMLPFFAEIQVM
jgi:hypothetical protein